MYTILSLDGGGVRGVISISILIAIEQKLKAKNIKLIDKIDMLAGTSTGAIIVVLLILGYDIKDILQMYLLQLPDAFQHSLSLDGLLAPKYQIAPLQQLVSKYAKDLKWSSLTKSCLIPTYNITKGQPHMFSTVDKAKDYYLTDIILAATAAPTYFTPAKVVDLVTGNSSMYLDGGVVANNPTMCALTEAIKINSKLDYFIISISCGHSNDAETNTANWGQLKWIQPLVGILIDANVAATNHIAKIIAEASGKTDQFYRFDCPLIKADGSLDNFSKINIDNLLIDVNNYLQTSVVQSMIDDVVNKLDT